MSFSVSGIAKFSQDKQIGLKVEPEHCLQFLIGHSIHFNFVNRLSGRKNPELQLKHSSCFSLHLEQFAFGPSTHFVVEDFGSH